MNKENKPTEVATNEHKQSGDGLRAKLKAEPCVWSVRMLAALKSGVKGGKWFSLNDKCFAKPTLEQAWKQVKSKGGSGGIDGVNLETFERHADKELQKLHTQLVEGKYVPQAAKRCWIPKAGSQTEMRPLGIPTIRDRIVQAAVVIAIGPIFEMDFAEHSYGFRPNRGCKDALRRVDSLLKQGCEWVVDADIRKFFDNVDHQILMSIICEKVADGQILKLVEMFLKQGIMDSAKGWQPTPKGTPQGAVLSPILSNIYLDAIDKEMQNRGFEMVRYADDFVVMCRSQEEAQTALVMVSQLISNKQLQIHSEKTRIVHHYDKGGFVFLGYQFEAGNRYPRKQSVGKLKNRIRQRTKRCNGNSMEKIIELINPTLKGWLEYFKHSYPTSFPGIDSWIRMRLRSIYRKRHHRKGRGLDHHRWPNAHFAEMGLFSLKQARRLAGQSR